MICIDLILRMMEPGELASGRIEIWSGAEDERQDWMGF